MIAIKTKMMASSNTPWKLWLALLLVAAFGPFLDVVTHQPVNWLLGLLVLLFLFGSVILWWRRQRPASVRSAIAMVRRHPVGLAFGIYILYFLWQAVRPETDMLQTLFALRWPLIGFAAYWTTVLLLADGEHRGKAARLGAFLRVVAIASLLASLYGLFQAAVGLETLEAWGLTQPGRIYTHNQPLAGGSMRIFRIFGPLRRNEALGAFLYLGLVASGTALILGQRPKGLFLASAAVSLPALGLTLSLASIGTLFLWLVGVLVFLPRYRRILLTVGGAGLVALIVVNFALGGLVQARINEHIGYAIRGEGRFGQVSKWLSVTAQRSPGEKILGTGVCTGLNESTLERVESLLQTLRLNIGKEDLFNCNWQQWVQDTWYGTLSLELGLLGLALFWSPFLVLGVLLVRWWWTKPKAQQPESNLILGLGALALWPAGWVGALIAYMPVTAYFWSIVALAEGSWETTPISEE